MTANSVGPKLCLAMTLACAAPACGGSDASSASGGITSTGATSAGAASQGGSAGAGGSGGALQGGTGGVLQTGSGGAAGGSGGSSSTTGDASIVNGAVDLSGTWIADVQTAGVLSVPTVGNVNANLGVIVRLVITEAGGALNARFDVCKMTAVTTPDPTTLTVTFTPAVLATLTTSISESAPLVHVGDTVPLPAITILSGITAFGTSVDADADSHPGVTIPGVVAGTWPVNVYVGLTVPFTFSGTLTAADVLSGTLTFSANGTIFGSDSPWLTPGGAIGVSPQPTDVPFTAKLLAGDVPCTDVLSAFP